jgi:histidine ammonia-lyase
MLSKQAFNALLKTLEEPPEHVKFLFATTEIEKVPITVRSRCIRFDLKRIESGLMIVQYTAAALVSENKVLSHPASVDSIPTSGNQEDHVSMGAAAARKAWQILRSAQQVIGIELVVACQALDFGSGRLGRGTAAAYRAVRERVGRLTDDRQLSTDLALGLALVESCAVLNAANAALGTE